MKKSLVLLIVLSLTFALNGCARNDDIGNDDIGNDALTPGNTSEDLILNPDGTANNTQRQNKATPMGTGQQTPYATSLRDLDGTLRTSVTDLDKVKIDANDKDYLKKQSDYYSQRASVYRKALNSVNRLSYTGNNRKDHDAIISYYQNGYDTYNNLSKKYNSFTSIEEERAYRDGDRDAFDLAPNINDAYERAIRSLGIRY
ncbi:MAG: hypothetical protein CVU84_12555 [Firmicutes bacterium HGW-Firmicutes-1]|jgi:hypothetical protein|nr:MAG: hypothetical protein CVU84_12555 [Firmicutes bacterium HGW-Firmicutes-1]